MKSNTEIQRNAFDEYIADIRNTRYQKVEKIIRKLKKGSVLEIGCCGGEFLELLRKQGWKVKGIEISKKAVQRARSKKIDVKTYDVNKKIPFKDESFDVIFAGELVEHVFDDVKFLNECYRLLKKGGSVILTTPNLLSLKNRFLMLFGFNPRYVLSPYHYHVYTLKVLGEVFKKSLFKYPKFKGNFIIYSKNREPILGGIFEALADFLPSLAEHFVIYAKK